MAINCNTCIISGTVSNVVNVSGGWGFFDVATTALLRGQDGSFKEQVVQVPIVCHTDKDVGIAQQFLKTGKALLVHGQYYNWVMGNGNMGHGILVNKFTFATQNYGSQGGQG